MESRLRESALAFALVAAALAASGIALEAAVRLFLPQQLIFYRPDLYREDALLGWHFVRDLDTRVNTGEREVELLTNERGQRVGPEAPARSERQVLLVGDSFVAGLQVAYPQLASAQLAERLSSRLGLEAGVVTDGVPGWGPQQYALEVHRELARAAYDAVVVFLFTGNDVVTAAERSFSIDQMRRRMQRRFRMPREASLAEFARAWLAPLDDALDTRSHLYVLVRSRLENLRIRLGLSPVFIPPALLRASAAGPEWADTAQICAGLAADAGSVPVLFVLLPAIYQVDRALFERHVQLLGVDPDAVDLDQPSRLLLPQLRARELTALDATPALRAAWQAGARDLYGRVDTHFEPEGHRVVAELLEPSLAELLLTR